MHVMVADFYRRCKVKYYVRKIQNPWILGKQEIQYLMVLYFPFFGKKYNYCTVVLDCTLSYISVL